MTTQNQTIRKILIAPDKFKGSLTSAQAAEAIRKGIQEAASLHSGHVPGQICAWEGESQHSGRVSEDICTQRQQEGPGGLEFRIIEIADGGDGSLEVLQKRLPGSRVVEVPVHDPVGKRVESQILLYDMPGTGDAGKAAVKKCAFIEMAKVSGLEMLSKGERNPLYTSTYGMGEAIRVAAGQGAQEITLSIGGSATNDGGSGMLQALGYRFLDAAGEEIAAPIYGGDLVRVSSIVAPGAQEHISACGHTGSSSAPHQTGAGTFEASGTLLQGVTFKVICDVTNPLLGQQGATAVYGPQKGADAQALQQLEAGLANYAAAAEKYLGVPQECKEHPGAGAAGGVGYAGLAFLGAELIPGWRFFAQITSLEESVQWADLVITGEGSLDSQSLSGKVVSGVLNLAAQYNKEVKIFCGVSKLTPDEMEAVSRTLPEGAGCYSIASLGHPLEICMRDAAELLQQLAREH